MAIPLRRAAMYYGAYKVGAFSAGRSARREKKSDSGLGSLLKKFLGGKKQMKKPPKGTSQYWLWNGAERRWNVANLTPEQASAHAARIRAMQAARGRMVQPVRPQPTRPQPPLQPTAQQGRVRPMFSAARDRRIHAIPSGVGNRTTGLRAITRERAPERRITMLHRAKPAKARRRAA